jgi:hypothetical protein
VLAVRTSRRVDDISNTGAGCVSVTFCDLDLQFQSLLAIDLMMMSDVLLCSGNEKARTSEQVKDLSKNFEVIYYILNLISEELAVIFYGVLLIVYVIYSAQSFKKQQECER